MEIRTPVLALKGLRPGPLDDGGLGSADECQRRGVRRLQAAYAEAGRFYHPQYVRSSIFEGTYKKYL
jgi:hypothetical protein